MPDPNFKDPTAYLFPSYLIHHNSKACKTRICYHPCIRVRSGDEYIENQLLIWGSDECYGRNRSRALLAATEELIITRKRHAWPMRWNRPPGGDTSILYNASLAEKMARRKHHALKIGQAKEMDEEIAALLESSLPAGRRDRKQAEKLQSGVNKLFGAPAGTGIDLGFKSTYDIPIPDQKIDTTPPNPLDKEAVEEYLAGMFGEAKKPDPNPEQPVENDSTITPRKEG